MGDARKSYRKSLGLFELVSLGLGGTIGSGIFFLHLSHNISIKDIVADQTKHIRQLIDLRFLFLGI